MLKPHLSYDPHHLLSGVMATCRQISHHSFCRNSHKVILHLLSLHWTCSRCPPLDCMWTGADSHLLTTVNWGSATGAGVRGASPWGTCKWLLILHGGGVIRYSSVDEAEWRKKTPTGNKLLKKSPIPCKRRRREAILMFTRSKKEWTQRLKKLSHDHHFLF